ncbi:hypothetical protein PB2503_09974 [Parvularcula bermudensis HTCC2503]|uniref:Acyl-CoA thioesterase II n=1 Tax=Parvularcula bermudensis (strain ATCC BAA-594 / HTCC2503 / KCTC 12087) TaxID=314260 RepID=E0TEG1_PARBH|nr:thioesterase family protein [Parvularcula bermudensis]ADM10047.1 hypothetical protein PB2503_09974 [Parvularcula bermudensis HTCC2503]
MATPALIDCLSADAPTVPERWMQGRTAYGGYSAALALRAARAHAAADAHLRSVQIAFVSPLTGPLTQKAVTLREGRSTLFVRADLKTEQGVGLAGTFVFARPQEAAATYETATFPAEMTPVSDAKDVPRLSIMPRFIENFDLRHGGAAQRGVFQWWVRLREGAGLDRETRLCLLGDALPPAALSLGPAAAVSSVTWQMNFHPNPANVDSEWWLLRSRTTSLGLGGSHQWMELWAEDGTAMVSGVQQIAVFG